MSASPQRIASRYLMSSDRTIEDAIRGWLESVGRTVASQVNGTSRMDFKKGHIAVIDVPNPEYPERIGIRFNAWTMRLTLHHQLGDDSFDVDSLEFPEFMKLTPEKATRWIISLVQPRQVTMFSSKK